ncbi:MAG: alternative ribosome rescue aminoacyl-tRNA hydrolase ArfB [Gemmatimonadota bacterium]
MHSPSTLRITSSVSIPLAELTYRASRSGGPGGQHVNTSSTRIELWWDLATSPSLREDQRQRALERLATRLDGDGRLRLVSSGSRSQFQNREDVTERFQALLAAALVVPKRRKATRPSKASKERRIEGKKKRGAIKRQRRGPPEHD